MFKDFIKELDEQSKLEIKRDKMDNDEKNLKYYFISYVVILGIIMILLNMRY